MCPVPILGSLPAKDGHREGAQKPPSRITFIYYVCCVTCLESLPLASLFILTPQESSLTSPLLTIAFVICIAVGNNTLPSNCWDSRLLPWFQSPSMFFSHFFRVTQVFQAKKVTWAEPRDPQEYGIQGVAVDQGFFFNCKWTQ